MNDLPDADLVQLIRKGDTTETIRRAAIKVLRERSPEVLEVEFLRLLRAGFELEAIRAHFAELQKFVEKAAKPPLRKAVILGMDGHGVVEVALGNQVSGLQVLPSVKREALKAGTEAWVNSEGTVVVSATGKPPRRGEVGRFDRRLPDGRLVLKSRYDEETVVVPGAALLDKEPAKDAAILFDRALLLGFEEVPVGDSKPPFIEDVPETSWKDIGGHGEVIQEIVSNHTLTWGRNGQTEVARTYKRKNYRGILLSGPPGTGKSLIARAIAHEIEAGFTAVIASEYISSLWGACEAKWRSLFRSVDKWMRETGKCAVILIEEIDAIGRARTGSGWHQHEERVLNTILAEMDGLRSSGALIVATTNRPELLDAALTRPGRLGRTFKVGRPGLQAARAILRIHLPADIPYAHGTLGGESARDAMIEVALSRIFAPGGPLAELATLRFRDGHSRVVGARDLISGAVLASVAQSAVDRAVRRDYATGESGVLEEDLVTQADERFAELAAALHPANVRSTLELPDDQDVVSVTHPRARRARGPALGRRPTP